MYNHLRGALCLKQPTRAVIEVGGVGYELTIPLSTFEALPAEGEVKLHTHLYVREDSLRLFGFASTDERRFFRRLLDVQGIGPAVALSILSSTQYSDFRDAVVTLMTLGFKQGSAQKEVDRILSGAGDAPGLEEIVREALRSAR